MLRFTDLTVRGFDIDALTVAWSVEPADPSAFNPADVEYRVLRSNSPVGPFELLTPTALVDVYSFRDTSLNRRSFWRKFYYKVEATHVPTSRTVESVVHRSEVPETLAVQMLEAMEIVRRERLLLQGVGTTPGYVGVLCAVFIRRTWGQRCMQCFNTTLGRSTVEKCVRCFNTRYVGGYYPGIPTYFNFSPSAATLQVTNWGEAQPSETDCWTTNFPLLSPGDMVVEPTNRRWKVSRQHPTERLRTPVRQLCRLHEITRSDVEYLLPVADSLFDREEFQRLFSNATEFEQENR